MLLNDIGKSPDATFKKINQHLESNYGFKISEDVNDKDLVVIIEQIEREITELKIKGNDAKESPEISKRLLVLEGIRNLREFAMLHQLQSPKLNGVISDLVNFVVATFEITGRDLVDFDAAVARAMDEYRSSKYRFPDDFIEQRVRQEAMCRIKAASSIPTNEPTIIMSAPMMEEESDTDVEEDDEAEIGEIEESTQESPVVKEKGTVMKENLVKNLRRLLETEVSQAEVMMAAKGFAKELQEMIEKIGRLQNEDLPPVTDKMRETYGTESSMAFQTQIAGALQGVMDALYGAKGQVDDAVSNLAETGQVSAQVDMDRDFGAELDGRVPVDNADSEMDADLDNIGADLEAEDEFGAKDEEEPLGRAMKEAALQRKVLEMQKLVAKARKLKEAKAKQ